MFKLTGISIILISSVLTANAQVVFNEASNRNYTQVLDEDGETNDWIELYNAGSSSVNLNGWYLSDSRKDHQKWQFGNNEISSGGFLLLHASGKDLSNIGRGDMHTNFKISNDGEWIFLSDPSGLVDSMYVDEVQIDHTTGRATDGASEWATFADATPGASNNSATAYTNGYADVPHFSKEAGFYNNSFPLQLSSENTSAEIRYTTDGSDPTSSSSLYTKPITISKTTCIKSRSFVTGKLASKPVASTYFINEEHTIPVLSLTTNNSNLYGSSGIFSNSRQEWNRPCYIEYFDENKTLVLNQASGIQVDGGAGGSRTKPQTSFRIEPDHGTFGEGAVKYNFHPERLNRNKYESLYLRNGSNRYLDLIYKDAVQVRGMGKNTHNFYSEYRPIVVYINGGYYGMYEGREKINADYLENNYDMNTDSLIMVGISFFKQPRTILPIVGSVEPFIEDYELFLTMDPSESDYLDKVNKFLDLDNYTDYMAGQTWMTNKDWPQNNMKAWRCKGSEMRWQFAIVDLEWSFQPTITGKYLATTPGFDQIAHMKGNGTQWPASGYWYKLMQNEEYKDRFINRMCDLMNTSYAYKELNDIETAIYEEALPEIPAYYERWNGPGVNDFMNKHTLFNSELEKRPPYVQEHLMKHYNLTRKVAITLDVEPEGAGSIQISTIIPNGYPWEGTYFSDVDIEITAIPNMGYTFEKWDDNSFISDIYSTSNVGELKSDAYTMKAYFTEDSEPLDGVFISEINYKAGVLGTPDWFEIFNATDQSFNINNWYFTDNDSTHVFTFILNRIIESGERLVVSNNPHLFRSIYPDVEVYLLGFGFGLGSPSDEIHLYNAQNEKVFSVNYSDLYPWPLANNNEGRTLELRRINGNYSESTAWHRGCIGGSPGTGYKYCEETIPNSNSEVACNPGKKLQMKVFPNPANTYIDFKMQLAYEVRFCNAAIFDLSGRSLKKVSYGQLNQGEYTHRINIEGVKPGVLILKVWTNYGENVLKIVKLDD